MQVGFGFLSKWAAVLADDALHGLLESGNTGRGHKPVKKLTRALIHET
jgi:hypothetical protein